MGFQQSFQAQVVQPKDKSRLRVKVIDAPATGPCSVTLTDDSVHVFVDRADLVSKMFRWVNRHEQAGSVNIELLIRRGPDPTIIERLQKSFHMASQEVTPSFLEGVALDEAMRIAAEESEP